METPNKGDSRWGSLFKNDLQGMLLPILLITIIGSVNIFSATYISSIYASHVAKNYDCHTHWYDLGSRGWCCY